MFWGEYGLENTAQVLNLQRGGWIAEESIGEKQ